MTNSSIRTRIETLLRERGLKWVDVYSKLGWHKTFSSKVLNGLFIPPLWQRVALAKEFNVDSSVIWDEPSIVSAYEIKGETTQTTNSHYTVRDEKNE
ncbi:MAG: hypothetical protein KJ718_01690 [Nanoarchaeota archaeon]|nr:hypothetical protein [Nanoarchaeota archaeon]MBU1051246.1 hypothetical protein [Nanoarchaeota archaeon]